jgi:multidrug efflux pump subunit AcrA (membrane-fusion protein)
MVAPIRSGRRIAGVLLGIVAIIAACLIWVPWQQTVIGYGQVMVYSAMDRPQEVEAQISARLVEWRVQEGQTVKKGDVIARLEDIDSKFLDLDQPRRLTRQRAALDEQLARARDRAARLQSQIDSLDLSRDAAIDTARQRVEQAKQRRRAAQQALIAAGKGRSIASDVARAAAGERVRQADDRVRQAEQALAAARQNLETSRLQRERVADLFAAGLRSKRDDELAENDLVKNRTEVRRAELALELARRDVKVGGLDTNRADLEIARAGTEVERARAALDVAERDVSTAALDLNKVMTDTAAALASVGASLESARESAAKIEEAAQKLDVERQNLRRRTEQQDVVAPRPGRVVRLLQVGAGATVKAGDVLAVLAPDTQDRAVELMVTDNDVPLLSEGRPVRLQFAGWPALQFSGWPSASVGTFAGRVAVIDAVDDGTARYRIIVKPDTEAVRAGGEQPWPKAAQLRPGAEVTGWVQLDTVPLGYELWRQWNAFPPTVKRTPVGQKAEKEDKSSSSGGYGGKEEKEKKSGLIKVKRPK